MLFKKKNPIVKKKIDSSGRYGAFYALLEYEKKGRKVENTLREWLKQASPKKEEYNLAQELAYGSIRRKITLDFYAFQLASKLKLREKLLLRLAIYQFLFAKKIPLYALVNETVDLAKKNISLETSKFFNATLRKLETAKFKEPSEKDLEKKYSYPKVLIDLFVKEYGLVDTIELLKVMNEPAKVMVRKRGIVQDITLSKEEARVIHQKKWQVLEIINKERISELVDSPEYYIQNVTPVFLMENLSLKVKGPQRILDLCAAPGGKLLMAADLYPEAQLFANDISEGRLKKLEENISKYHLEAVVSNQPAEKMHNNKKFDLIIVDAPCSNTGVLHKRCEARYVITKDHLKGLAKLQYEIMKNAFNLLADEGKIWFMTCSILSSENESFIEKILQNFPLQVDGKFHKVLPTKEGWDGGFGCVLKRS
ncbi:MAG: hypothetical protein COT84_00880 [Chlamydiae bacterium CG10_big_fil_rev_8_21_14_0_10_35_9]|nr:MAG: hypothetical protein COT84_00880 [Chlamydiae bacterium CG10_big_fil_rev_8_21_14_0_10_35_9]